MKRQAAAALCALAMLSLVSTSSCSGGGQSPDLWLSDFDLLKQEMAAGYANLDWAAQHNDIDMAALVHDTEVQLGKARSARAARKILDGFLETFHDPHLRAQHTDPPNDTAVSGGTWTGPSRAASAKDALEAFGYNKGKYDFGVDFEAIDGFEKLEAGDNPFPAGVLTLEGGRRIGVVRIKYFGEDRYYDVARRTWEESQGDAEGTCDQDCWWRFTLRVRSRLMELLEARLDALAQSNVDAILVDITGNGGGSEWCEDVAQLFTTRRLRPPPAGFIKHPHWEQQIEHELGWIEKDLARDDLPSEIRTMLLETQAAHRALLEEVRAGCDGSALWEGGSPTDCSRLSYDKHGLYDVPEGAEKLAAALASEHLLFRRSRHPDHVARYGGPLIVTIDTGTASAAEQFATLLQFNHAATLVGERSYGAGCGYTNGGIKLYLPNTELRVWMSDCVRVRADGENELSGVEPDVAGWEPGAKGKDRARSLAAVLRNL